MEEEKKIIDLSKIFKTLWDNKRKFLIVWIITFILSCVWIFPQPRYYQASVSLAPEITGEISGGLAGIASSLDINIGNSGTDALYPTLYPELMTSNDFIVGLMPIQVTTEAEDDEPSVTTDYYTYLDKYQKTNPLTQPLHVLKNSIKRIFS